MKTLKSLALGLAAFFAAAAALPAQNLIVSLVAPPRALAPAATVKLDLLAVNPSVTEATFAAPRTLHGALLVGDKSWPVQLDAGLAGPRAVAPGAFAYRGYVLTLPAGVTGRAVLEITDGDYAPLRSVLMISAEEVAAATPAPDAKSKAAPGTPLSTLDAATPALARVQRSFVGHFAPHEPVYFIYGTKAPGAKFQFSFKYRLLDFPAGPGSAAQRSLQFGYTQRSLWDIAGDSSPFYDTSYMPAFFFESLASQSDANRAGPFRWVGYQAGYQHESNGQGLTASRSLNTLWVRSAFIVGAPEDWHVIVVPKVWTYVADLSNNPDIENYRGYGELSLVFGRNGGTALAYTGRAGKDFNHVTTQLDLTIPIRLKLLDFASYFLVQYFDGYGESLRDYNRRSTALRAGISLVR
jgi:outer membrane phospholipase A